MKIFYWLFAVAIFCLILVIQRVEERRLGLAVAALEKEVALKESRNQYMKYRISVLSSPAVINKTAQDKLGLQLTPAQNVVVLEYDR